MFLIILGLLFGAHSSAKAEDSPEPNSKCIPKTLASLPPSVQGEQALRIDTSFKAFARVGQTYAPRTLGISDSIRIKKVDEKYLALECLHGDQKQIYYLVEADSKGKKEDLWVAHETAESCSVSNASLEPSAEMETLAQNLIKAIHIQEPEPEKPEKSGKTASSAMARLNKSAFETMVWTLMKNKQIGYKVYEPLIQTTIGTTARYDTPDFAKALRKWQIEQGLPNKTGVIDAATFARLSDLWQSKRSISRIMKNYEHEIVQIDREDLHHKERAASESRIGKETYRAYKKMIEAARKDGIDGDLLKIVSAFRDPKHQQRLLKNVKQSKVNLTVARTSIHETGRSIDLHVGGVPVTSKDANRLAQVHNKAYQWLLKNAEKYGFRNYFYEPWHWDYVLDVAEPPPEIEKVDVFEGRYSDKKSPDEKLPPGPLEPKPLKR